MKTLSIGTRILDPVVDYAGLARPYGVCGEGPIEEPKALRPAPERAVRHVKDKKLPALLMMVTYLRLMPLKPFQNRLRSFYESFSQFHWERLTSNLAFSE